VLHDSGSVIEGRSVNENALRQWAKQLSEERRGYSQAQITDSGAIKHPGTGDPL